MFRKLLIVGCIVATSSCLLVQTGSAPGAAARPERPLKLRGMVTVVHSPPVFDFASGRVLIAWELSGEGEGTHVGRHTARGAGTVVIDLATGRVINESAGTLTAANGDALAFTGEFTDDSTVRLSFGPGTGRFADATGEATQTLQLVSQDGPAATYEFEIVGSLAY